MNITFENQTYKIIKIDNEDTNYAVSESGQVINYKSGKVLKAGTYGKGYKLVSISINGKPKTLRVHRLVAIAFIPNPENCEQVNHKDEDKTNNHVDNLEWCNNQYNAEYSKAKSYTLKSPEGEVVEVFNLNKFCKENDLSQGSMGFVINGVRNHHKGWTKA